MTFLDFDAIKRFTDAVNNHDMQTLEGVSLHDARAAALCLSVLLNTSVNVRGLLGIKGKRGPKKRKKLDETIHSEEFGIIVDLESEKITYTEAENMLMEKFYIDKSTAQRFIKDRRPAARDVARQMKVINRIINQ